MKMLKRIVRFFTGKCPNCGGELDDNAHGYGHKWNHCHACGWCNHAIRFGNKRCSVK
jgi:hypothetical protein